MKGQVSHELDVGVPASAIWQIYRGLELGKLAYQLLPEVIQMVEVVEGDGGVGTVLKVTFPPGLGFSYMKEKFTRVDDEHRIKDTVVVEGGYLNFGFTFYLVRFEIVEKDAESSIIRSIIEYEVGDESAEKASLVSTKPLEAIGEAIAKHLTDNKPTV